MLSVPWESFELRVQNLYRFWCVCIECVHVACLLLVGVKTWRVPSKVPHLFCLEDTLRRLEMVYHKSFKERTKETVVPKGKMRGERKEKQKI